MTVHKRCCYYLKPEEVCKGHPVRGKIFPWDLLIFWGFLGFVSKLFVVLDAASEGGGGEGGRGQGQESSTN